MIELPDGKVCHNLPEQVGENAKNIKKIIEYLNGVDIESNLVVVADISQTLSSSELSIITKPVAFIYYNNELYIKRNENSGNAYFCNVFSIQVNTDLDFQSNQIEVNLGTGSLTLTSATATTYKKDQIDILLSAKANDNEVAKLTGAAFSGGITSPSIIELMPGYTFTPNTSVINQNDIYIGVSKTGNKLTIVQFYSFIGQTFTGQSSNPVLGRLNIPPEIGQKIIPFTVGGSNNIVDLKTFTAVSNDWEYKTVHCGLEKVSNHQLQFRGFDWNLLSFTTGKTYYVRYEITILLSENLVA